MLHKVEPAEKGIPHFKNIYVSNVSAKGVKKLFNAAGLKESSLVDFHFENIKSTGASAGDIEFAKNWTLNKVDLTRLTNQQLNIKNSDALRVLAP